MGRAARTFGRSGWAWQGENVSTTPEAEEGEMDGQPGLVDAPEEADEIGAAEDEMDGLPDLESDASEEEDEIGAAGEAAAALGFTHFYERAEYQSRGSAHRHAIWWRET
jgi:hypothetical protein